MSKLFHTLVLILGIGATTLLPAAGKNVAGFRAGGEMLKYRAGEVNHPAGWTDKGTGSIAAGGWVEHGFEVPTEGWYGLYYRDLPNLAREIFVDGERVDLSFGESPKSAAELLGIPLEKITADGWTKTVNLALKAGKHTVRFQRIGRMGHPAGFPREWEIRAAGSSAADRLRTRVDGHRELRKGEPLRVSVTGGHGPAAKYELFRIDELNQRSERIAELDFPESDGFITKTVTVPADAEGVFQLHAKTADGRLLTPQEFISGSYFVVDTIPRDEPAGKDAQFTLLHSVDCVANTVNGQPVASGLNYWEANGATRINETPAGKYRESNTGQGPEVDPHPKQFAENFSGFGYLLKVANPGRPLMIEIDHPDDDWRSVCVSIVDVFDREKKKGYLPPTFAYETGGYLPLSNTMLTERIMFWPNGGQVHLSLVSSRIGKRAGAARIRVYEVAGSLPSQTAGAAGRFSGVYMEEMKRWHTHFNTPKDLAPAVRDFIGLTRTMEWAAYRGVNAFWPTAAAYQEITYDSAELQGYLLQYHNTPRLSALLCEKYNLGYVAEIFLAKQRYFNTRVMIEGAEHPEDLYTASWWGYRAVDSDSSGGILPSWNVLHPHVQAKMIAIYGELADSLGDTESFVGLAGRIDAWQWDGLYGFGSLNWGYEDWTVGEFTKDTGIQVPGDQGDPQRYEKRFRFLTEAGMKDRWVAWRKARVTDYLLRLSERIRRAKKDATLFLCGDARTDESHGPSIPESMSERLDGMGIDRAAFGEGTGVALLPTAGYGRGKTRTYLADQTKYDAFADVDYINTGKNAVRGFAPFGTYQEWGDEFPLGKLGIPLERWWYTSGSDAAGRNSLERLSTVLAEQDTMVLRDGGYPLTPGRHDFYSEWMAEFTRLPRLPFTPVALARDPVAVRERSDKAGYLFYVVNRDQYPVNITLWLTGAGRVTRLGTGQDVILAEGAITLSLQPYELRAFRADKGAALRSADVPVPPEAIEFVRGRLAYAQELAGRMDHGLFADSFTQEEKTDFHTKLAAAWEALQGKAYWRARTLLASAPLMAVYEQFGEYPAGQVRARFSGILANAPTDRFAPEEPFVDADGLLLMLAKGTEGRLVDSENFNPEWRFAQVLVSGPAGLELDLNVPVTGYYRLSIGHVAAAAGVITVTVDGRSLPVPMNARLAGEPEKTLFPKIFLEAGIKRLSVRRPDAFGLYALKLAPVLRPLPTTLWSTVGPFRSFWTTNLRGAESDAAVLRGAETLYPPQKNAALDEVYRNEDGRELRWSQTREIVGSNEEAGVNFSPRIGVTGLDYGFAQTFITSPKEQDVVLHLGSDWWANAYLNGELLKPEGNRAEQERTGMWFMRWKPKPVTMRLKPGVNTLLVKNQGGSMNCWFTCHISDPGDLMFSATPPAR